jgi:RHS repeat-associated protein
VPIFGFNGEMQDASAMVYLRAWWYNPQQELFGVCDSFKGFDTQPDMLHPYMYVGGNPVNRDVHMKIPCYTQVRLVTNKYWNEGANHGMIGYIIEIHAEGVYEVEFSDSEGVTLAQIVVKEEDIEVYE